MIDNERPNYAQLIKDARYYSNWKERKFNKYLYGADSFQGINDFMEYLYWVETVSRELDRVGWNTDRISLDDHVDNIVLNSDGPTFFWKVRKTIKVIILAGTGTDK